MDLAHYLSFLLVSFLIVILPGPNVLVIVQTSLTSGARKGLQTVAGTTCAMILQLGFVAAGTTWLVTALVDGLHYLKWIGVVYLLYMAIRHLYAAVSPIASSAEIGASKSFFRGFVVSLSNPKTLLFFSAFFPQFITSSSAYHQQFLLLAASFVALATLFDSCYALLASFFTVRLSHARARRLQHGCGGILFLGAGGWLASNNLT